MDEIKGKITDKSQELLGRWEEKSRDLIGNFLELFGPDGRLVSLMKTFSKTRLFRDEDSDEEDLVNSNTNHVPPAKKP